jgi:hypothetical protein
MKGFDLSGFMLGKTPYRGLVTSDINVTRHLPSILPNDFSRDRVEEVKNDFSENSRRLSAAEIKALILRPLSDKNISRAKRDLAILSLILDNHLPRKQIAKMTFGSIKSIVAAVHDGRDINVNISYYISVINEDRRHRRPDLRDPNLTMIKIHPFTAYCIYRWVEELVVQYHFDYNFNNPLFVNAHPIYDSNNKITLRKQVLTRDAISKIFLSLKEACGIHVPGDSIKLSGYSFIEGEYRDLIDKIDNYFGHPKKTEHLSKLNQLIEIIDEQAKLESLAKVQDFSEKTEVPTSDKEMQPVLNQVSASKKVDSGNNP